MPFDQPTRNALAKMVGDCRRLLTEDIRKQLQGTYGLQPDGTALSLDALGHLDERALGIARELRDWRDHLAANEVGHETKRRTAALERLVRETSFTVLNRLAALRLCEERGHVIECVRRSMASDGFQLFERLSGGALGPRGEMYRVFLDRMCDELATDLGVLFDLRDPRSLVFPEEQCLDQVLALLNAPALAPLWQQDETIGWIYQYFNDPAERKKMREQSAAPRNSHELAVRNQFFTPRYVVEFLTDNTLGRIWYEMTKGETRLKDQCRYLLRRKRTVFFELGQLPPEPFQPPDDFGWDEGPGEMCVPPNPSLHTLLHIWQYALTVNGYEYAKQRLSVECGDLANSRRERYRETKRWDGTFEELRCCLFFEQRRYRHFGSDPDGEDLEAINALYKAICERWDFQNEYVAHRLLKDPRDIRLLDPACGSMHFGLYAFDLFEVIYDEAWELEEKVAGEAPTRPPGMKSLHDTYAAKDTFLKDVPRLIIEYNIHGIDIDPRCAQIAGLSLWLRAQKAWQRLGLKPAERPAIKRSNIVCAEPMPGEKELLREFVEREFPAAERGVFFRLLEAVFDKMQLAGEAGSLLKIEEEIRGTIAEAKKLWEQGPKPSQTWLFPEAAPAEPKQMKLDLSGITDEQFWERAEERIYAALRDYTEHAENGGGFQRRLFAEDAAQGFAFIDVCRRRYDVALMNPPFGAAAQTRKSWTRTQFPLCGENILVSFICRTLDLLIAGGRVGCITDRSWLQKYDYRKFRAGILAQRKLATAIDLGWEVLDGANVETAVSVFSAEDTPRILFANDSSRADLDRLIPPFASQFLHRPEFFNVIPHGALAYSIHPTVYRWFADDAKIDGSFITFQGGIASGDSFRTGRCHWEVYACQIGLDSRWAFVQAGSPYSPFYYPTAMVTLSESRTFKTILSNPTARTPATEFYGRPGVAYGKRTDFMYSYAMPAGAAFSWEGQAGFVQADDITTLYRALAFTNSSTYIALANLVAGQHKYAGYLNTICCELPQLEKGGQMAEALIKRLLEVDAANETSLHFCAVTANKILPLQEIEWVNFDHSAR